MSKDREIVFDKYSVLISVYYREKAAYLRAAMDSMWDQTVSTDDMVLVCDGPLGEDLDAVITEMEGEYSDRLHVIRLEKNRGLGYALNVGLKHCRNELVARMDSDDVSRPDRCEQQLRVFASDSHIGICSGIVEEFSESPDTVLSQRVVPENHEEIMRFAGSRNPFNHPCVMFRKDAVEAAGGYQDFYLVEDYYLWIRMLQNGTKGYNIQSPLLWMRTESDIYRRRKGLKYAKSQQKLFKYMRSSGFIDGKQAAVNTVLKYTAALMPASLLRSVYMRFLRERNTCPEPASDRRQDGVKDGFHAEKY